MLKPITSDNISDVDVILNMLVTVESDITKYESLLSKLSDRYSDKRQTLIRTGAWAIMTLGTIQLFVGNPSYTSASITLTAMYATLLGIYIFDNFRLKRKMNKLSAKIRNGLMEIISETEIMRGKVITNNNR